jgi:hypothetical protein
MLFGRAGGLFRNENAFCIFSYFPIFLTNIHYANILQFECSRLTGYRVRKLSRGEGGRFERGVRLNILNLAFAKKN